MNKNVHKILTFEGNTGFYTDSDTHDGEFIYYILG